MEQIPEIIGDALAGAGDPTRNGYAIIIVLSMLIVGALAYKGLSMLADYLDDREKRIAEREEKANKKADQRIEESKIDLLAQLENERAMREDYRRMAGDYNIALSKVTEAFGENSAVLRQARDEIRRSTEASERNTAAFHELMAMLPRQRNALRKTPVEKEATHNA